VKLVLKGVTCIKRTTLQKNKSNTLFNLFIRIFLFAYMARRVKMSESSKTEVELERAANILKLLGDKTRLTMIKILDNHDACVCEFVEIFKTSQPAISQHVRKLKDAGLVRETRRGQWIIYSLNKDSEYFPLIKDLFLHLPNQDFRLKVLEEQGLRISCE
jgi:ArsR family transcriptional regulator, arsenate/arsenite/antimonite-responsive transcriptional repressor